jgi:predicted O-methyltransferase YrrM
MDAQVTAVLDIYHERIRDEHRRMREALQAAGGVRPSFNTDEVLLAVGPETGQLINIVAASFKAPSILEIGTSFGYSGIWLAEAARASGGRLTTLEIAPHKQAYAKQMSQQAGLADHVDFRLGDAVELINQLPGPFDFILLDLWKDLYVPCLEAFFPKLNPGAIIVADNMIMPGGEEVAAYGRAVRAKPGITSVLLPVGQGIEVSRLEAA